MTRFRKVKDPAFFIEVSPGDTRKLDPWRLLESLSEARNEKGQRDILNRELGVKKMTHQQSYTIMARVMAYAAKADRAYQETENNAELMYYLHLRPGELRKLSNLTKLSLLHHVRRIRARERLDFQYDICAVLDKDGGPKLRAELTKLAFSNDEDALARQLEMISRI